MKLRDKVLVVNRDRFCKKIKEKYLPSCYGHVGLVVGIDESEEYPIMVEFGEDLNGQINYFNERSLVLV